MKRLSLLSLILLAAVAVFAADLCVGSYNIRYRNQSDSIAGDQWPRRCHTICSLINFQHPDVFGAQEVLHPQLLDLLSGLDGYRYVGVGRDDGHTQGEYAPIFYHPSRLQLLDSGHFWLSPTPDTPSLGWDAACIRICTWAKLRDLRSDSTLYFFNLHTDHVGTEARRRAALMVVDSIAKVTAQGHRAILTGDFNVDQSDPTYAIFTGSGLLNDAYSVARIRLADNGTFNSFDPTLHTDSRIDHIFLSPSFSVDRYGILTNIYWTLPDSSASDRKGKDAPDEINFTPAKIHLPSDHYPVIVHIR